MQKIAQLIRHIVGVSATSTEKDLHTEISEKQTTKLGYLLIILMVLFGVGYGQTVLSDLQNNIKYPTPLPQCISTLESIINNPSQINNYYGYGYYSYGNSNGCATADPKYAAFYAQAKNLDDTVSARQKDVSNAEANLQNDQYRQSQNRDDYDITLQERQAGTLNPTLQGTQQTYTTGRTQLQIARDNKDSAQSALILAENALRSFATLNSVTLKEMQRSYDRAVFIVELERALLQLIFIAPLFWFTLRRWFIARDKGTSTAIIWTGAASIFGILFAQVICVFIYDIIPHHLLEVLFAWIAQMEWVLTLLRYALLILVPAIFGFIVYQIQKRIFNPRAVFMRALKAHKCARCGMSITPEMRHCPACGNTLKEPCPSGGHDRIAHAPFCDVCGKGE